LAHAGAQVKAAMDATIKLGGENYVFWGGREGYFTLLNTMMGKELDNLGMFLTKARDYARANGYDGRRLECLVILYQSGYDGYGSFDGTCV